MNDKELISELEQKLENAYLKNEQQAEDYKKQYRELLETIKEQEQKIQALGGQRINTDS